MNVDMAKVLEQHRMTFPIETSVGTIVLGPVTRMRQGQIMDGILKDYPDYNKLSERAEQLDKACKMPHATEEMKAELGKLIDVLGDYNERFLWGCFHDPEINSMEELDALLSAIDPELAYKIEKLLQVLFQPAKIDKVLVDTCIMCKAFGIPLAKDLTMENMTADQAALLTTAANEMAREQAKALGGT
jgi:hypothetical protein